MKPKTTALALNMASEILIRCVSGHRTGLYFVCGYRN